MVLYRRIRIPGDTYFFTVTLRDRSSALLVEPIGLLRAAFRAVRVEHPFRVHAIVVLPDHLHAIRTLPVDDADCPGRWRSIKSRFTGGLLQRGVPLHRDGRGEYRLWQRRYWEHTIRDDRDRERHVDYLHFYPVKQGLAGYVADWPHNVSLAEQAPVRSPPPPGKPPAFSPSPSGRG